MRQVLEERQEQVMQKLNALKDQQQETYERRKALIEDMEQARKYDLMEKQKQAREREDRKQDIQRQVRHSFPFDFLSAKICYGFSSRFRFPLLNRNEHNLD